MDSTKRAFIKRENRKNAKARKRYERSHRLDKILTAGDVKKKSQKHEALTWDFW